MRRCSVPGCFSNFTKPYVSVFTFPKDPTMCKLWLKSIGRPTLKVHENIGVCIKHFEKHLVCGINSSDSHRKKLSIRPGAVPTIFEDVCSSDDNSKMEEKVKSVENFTRMQSRGSKSPLASVSHTSVHTTCRQDGERKGSSKKFLKKASTTDRPIITVVKAEDLIMAEDKSPEKINEDDDCIIEVESPSKSFSLPSPFKNMPNVSVCLKEEDRVPFTRELKGVKRSPSTGSNSSTGSSEAQKLNSPLVKRRKVEKPAPVVIGRQNDCYCWVCHRENISLCCIACPRAYHPKCAGELSVITPDWVCPECQKILAAENVDSRSSTLAEISLDKLGALLKLSLNKMKQRAPIAFHQPVSLEHYPLYPHYVIHPMDFSLLEKNIKQKVYGCTEAFLADVKWISHNSCVFNGTQHPLSTNAKNLVKSCDQDMQEIEVCPDCFVHSVVRNKYWFSEVCRKPHPLVWAKLKGFPYWPAKVVRILDGNVDARFFGAHDRAWVPVSQCYHLSKEMPTTSKPKKKGNYEVALDELNVHVHLLIQKFGCFEYAAYRTSFNPQNKVLMYHGIDIDKVAKEEISFDTSSPVPEKYCSSEKENRFASFLESEKEKLNPDEGKSTLNPSENCVKSPLKMNDGLKSLFHFTERKSTESMLSEKETVEDETNHEKSMLEDKTNAQERNTEEKKSDTSQVSPFKISEKVSASDQFRKLELALERIKGYVSLTAEQEKESNELQMEDKEETKNEEDKHVSEEVNKDETEKSTLFKETIVLPVIETDNVQESDVDVTKSLETTKKTDSFFLKLNETIKSCKAKLGISEVADDLSDESGADENASRSDEDEEDNSSASDAEEELSDEEVEDEEDDEEDEVVEVSDEEENDDNENELGNKVEETGDENSESDESISESSGTDIDANNSSPKKADKSIKSFENNVKEITSGDKEINFADEDGCKMITNDNVKEITIVSSEASITNPDLQVPEVTVDDSGALEVIGENSSSEILTESSNDMKENNSSNEQFNQAEIHQTVTSSKQVRMNTTFADQHNIELISSKDESSSIVIESSDGKNASTHNFDDGGSVECVQHREKGSYPVKTKNRIISLENDLGERQAMQSDVELKPCEGSEVSKNLSTMTCKSEPVEEDDDIYICTPTRPKSPPVIVIDDDAENSSVSDTFAVKSPPYSTAESFSNEENLACRTNLGDEQGNSSPSKVLTVINGRALGEVLHKRKELEMNGISYPVHSNERQKRKLSSEDSSDDEVQIVSPFKKTGLTGAKRTFKKCDTNETIKRVDPTIESVRKNLAAELLGKGSKSTPPRKTSEVESDTFRPETTLPHIPQSILRTPVIDTGNLSNQENETMFLKRKLNCLMTAYKIQGWKCTQEREELRHNMNLINLEMRACLESDKKQAIDNIIRNLEQEKQKCIEETKRKQWCANCLTESRYSCCWNTSYCSVDCQKRHFPEHRNSCSQLKSKNIEIVEVKSNAVPSTAIETNENKKLIIVNMKPPDVGKATTDRSVSLLNQQIPVSKPDIQMLSAKSTLQIPSSGSSSNPVQFVLASVKSSTESNVATSAPSALNFMEKGLDSAQIITHVRNKACDLGTAISLLKKKNLESTVSVLTKKKEQKKHKEDIQKDANLEEVYFPSPPTVTFEGYDSVNPDPNLDVSETEEVNHDMEAETSELQKGLSPERDLVLSDTDDIDNEMVNIGHAVMVKAKFLNKCLVYGQTAKKLTRCLVDIIFPDVKLLATCSAFGQKSNVTKLTRAALPARKVHAIIDFVNKRFPDALRSDIVLAINTKCKEARHMLNKKECDSPKKTMARRSLAREQEDELASTITTTPPIITTSTSTILAPVITPKNSPNVVCVKSSTQPQTFPFNMPKKPGSVPNILRCSPQILIRPKPIFNTVGNAAVHQTPQQPKKRETVKEILSRNKTLAVRNMPKDGPKIVMAVDAHKQSATITQPVSAPSSSTSVRPLIIMGSHVNAAKQPSSVQNPTLPVSSSIKK